MALSPVNGFSFQVRPTPAPFFPLVTRLRARRGLRRPEDTTLPRCEKTFLWHLFAGLATAAQLGDGKGRQVFASRNLMRMAVCGCVTLTCLAAAGASDTKDPQKAAAKQAQLDATPGAVEPRVAASGKSDKYDLDRIGARGVGGGLNMYSLQRERELGAAMAATLDRNTKFCPDPDVYVYVNQLAQNLARNSDSK